MKSSRKQHRHASNAKIQNTRNKSGVVGASPSKRHREKLNSVMDELCELLPLSHDVKAGLDRLSVLKLTVSFLNTQSLMINDQRCTQIKTDNQWNISELALQAIGGFFMIITEDGLVNYVSENVKPYLGYSQTRLMHEEFFPMVHSDDLHGLKSCFDTNVVNKVDYNMLLDHCSRENSSFSRDSVKECFCNIRCHAGRLSSHISPFFYKCFKFYGRIKTIKNSLTCQFKKGFFALCTPVSTQVNVHRPLNNNIKKYTCKMNAAMSNLWVDSRGMKHLSLNEKDLSGHSAYFFFHKDDLPGMAAIHEVLLLGSRVKMTFRVLKGSGKWQWVRGRAYSIIHDGKCEGMVAENVFLSEEEGRYFKEQDQKDILTLIAEQKALPECKTNQVSSVETKSTKMLQPRAKTKEPNEEVPPCLPNVVPSLPGNALPGAQRIEKNERSSCQASQNTSYCDVKNEAVLKIVKDLQSTFYNGMNQVIPNMRLPEANMMVHSPIHDIDLHLLEDLQSIDLSAVKHNHSEKLTEDAAINIKPEINLHEDTIQDFVPLPLMEVENILCNNESALPCSYNSPTTYAMRMETTATQWQSQQNNYFQTVHQDQIIDENFNFNQSDNEVVLGNPMHL